MKDVTGATSEETRMLKAVQTAVGAYANGIVGNQTMSDIAIKVKANCFPLNVELYGMPTLIAKDIEPLNPKGPTPKNGLSGSFSNGYNPCSVLIQNGKAVCWSSCHYTDSKKPESVIYKTKDGKVQIKRVGHISEDLPLNNVVWAVGGFGLMDFYDPKAEGFTGKFSDVLRTTNHTVLGHKNGMMFGVYCKNMSASQINTFVKTKLKLEFAIMLDGGHIAAINAAVNKINVNQKQLYAIKFM